MISSKLARRAALLALSIAVALACSPRRRLRAQAGGEDGKEPPLLITVQVGDKTVTAREGESVKVPGTFTDPEVKVSPEPHRVFPYAGMSFKYPRAFTFEADFEDPSVKIWTLSGNDVKLMIFASREDLNAAEFLDDLRQNFKGGAGPAEPTEITLGGKTYRGKKALVTIASHTLSYDVIDLPDWEGRSRLLSIQDSPSDGERSTDAKIALKVLEESFTLR